MSKRKALALISAGVLGVSLLGAGVSSVIIPLAEKAKPRRIEISHTAKTASSQAIES